MRDEIQIVIKIPNELFIRYLRVSKLNGRSLNEQVLKALSSAIAQKQEQKEFANAFGRANKAAKTIRDSRRSLEESLIRFVLNKNNWNITKSAKELGVSRPTIYDLIAKYQVKINNPSSNKSQLSDKDIA
jgi:DNA-binding NtrC family response regulator